MDDKSDAPLTCSSGTPWLDHFQPPIGTGKGCDGCRQACEASIKEAWRLYEAGEYDMYGFSPAERKAERRRLAHNRARGQDR